MTAEEHVHQKKCCYYPYTTSGGGGGGGCRGANFLANRDPDHTAQAVQSGLAVDFL